jgi:hypothetical protein
MGYWCSAVTEMQADANAKTFSECFRSDAVTDREGFNCEQTSIEAAIGHLDC